MKTGILGGTFDPIHIAHVYLAKQYSEKLGLDKVIFVPTFIPPHKFTKKLAGAKKRLEMCRIALEKYPGFEICGYEIEQEGKSYTYRTLRYLRETRPNEEFFLLMGADMFMTVQDWRHAAEIYKMATLCAAERQRNEFLSLEAHAIRLQNEGARCVIIEMKPMPLSSTDIRTGIGRGEDVSGLLDPGVWKFIKDNRLYGV